MAMSTDRDASDIGLIVGSGYARLGLEIVARRPTKTPYGPPSSPLITAALGPFRVSLIVRHGEQHSIAPHEVNYRANIWALHQIGVRRLIGLNTVGAIAEGFAPGTLAVPEQLIDYTWGRLQTFGGEQPRHIDFSEPFDRRLSAALAEAARQENDGTVTRGVYGVTQGPRLETAAEIDRLDRDGCAMVGMTALPEAALARELEIRYAICAIAVNHAAGRGAADTTIPEQFDRHMTEGVRKAAAMLARVVPTLAADRAM